MDIRARLLIAFSPLLVLLIGTAIALPIIERDANTLLNRQLAAVDNLSSIQAFEVYVVREHSAIIHSQIQRLRDAFQQLLDVNRKREQQLTTTLGELEERIAHEAQLRATVQALSVPTVPLGEGMLLLPLMGHLDAQRLAAITSEVLERIQQERARALVIDFTGLPELSTVVVAELGRMGEAARLLGCRATLVGIRAEHAASLAASDLASSGVAIARDIPALLSTVGGAQNVVQSSAL